jgi:hypothetical protein
MENIMSVQATSFLPLHPLPAELQQEILKKLELADLVKIRLYCKGDKTIAEQYLPTFFKGVKEEGTELKRLIEKELSQLQKVYAIFCTQGCTQGIDDWSFPPADAEHDRIVNFSNQFIAKCQKRFRGLRLEENKISDFFFAVMF